MCKMCVSRDHHLNMTMWGEFLYQKFEIDNKVLSAIYCVIYFFIFVFSLISNLLTCYVIYFKKSMHTPMNCYIFNLAICDLLGTVSLFSTLLFFVLDIYKVAGWMCTTNWFFVVFLWNYSILLLTTMAIERYLAICHPFVTKTRETYQRATRVVFFIWTFSFLETLPNLWVMQLIPSRNLTLCFMTPTTFTRHSGIILVSISYFIPLFIMLLVYTLIAYKVNTMQSKQTVTGQVFNYPNNRRVTMLAVALTVSFVITWLPLTVVRLTVAIYDVNELVQMPKWYVFWTRLSTICSWISMVLNPLLFSLFSTKFRKALKELWGTRGQQNSIM